MKIFLTGGTGFIGRNFIKIASKSNYIFALTRKKRNKSIKNVKWIYGNIGDDLKRYLKKSDVLIHLAAEGVLNKNISFNDCFNTNVSESLKLLSNSYKAGCHKWIIVGSSSEYGNSLRKNKPISKDDYLEPLDNYSISKMILGKIAFGLAEQWKIKLLYFRLFPVYGFGENKNRLMPLLKFASKNKKNFILKNPNARIDFSDVTDVCKTILEACYAKSNTKVYSECWHIASGEKQTVKNFVINQWNLMHSKGKVIISKKPIKNVLHHISDKKSIWPNK